ncbi:hypothetical protein HHX47_DHR8000215 [Lentinula edodes]|nr:hypothetical protein HHX47_DHR8000215 [Lentinula edodes]
MSDSLAGLHVHEKEEIKSDEAPDFPLGYVFSFDSNLHNLLLLSNSITGYLKIMRVLRWKEVADMYRIRSSAELEKKLDLDSEPGFICRRAFAYKYVRGDLAFV